MKDNTKPPSQTLLYWTWQRMKSRCHNPTSPDYYLYGARGIKVCDRWLESYENFYNDMGEKPDGLSLDRINNNGNYEPENCRWATATEQANNKRNNYLLTIDGKTQTLSQWAKEKDIHHNVLLYRINAGMKPDELFSKQKVKPKDYLHLKNLSRKDNVYIEFEGVSLTLAQWAEKYKLNQGTLWHRIYDLKWSIEDSLTIKVDRPWLHGTNNGYSKHKCRCKECTEFNRIKSKRARDSLKLKKGEKCLVK